MSLSSTGKKPFSRTSTSNSPKATATASSEPTAPENPRSLKILSGQLETTSGDVTITPGQRPSWVFFGSVTTQIRQFLYWTPSMGNQRLYDIMKEKEAIYMKEDFTDEDGIRASERG